jgi:hypothetical protein
MQNQLFDIETDLEVQADTLIRSFTAVAAPKSPMTNFLRRRTDNHLLSRGRSEGRLKS